MIHIKYKVNYKIYDKKIKDRYINIKYKVNYIIYDLSRLKCIYIQLKE